MDTPQAVQPPEVPPAGVAAPWRGLPLHVYRARRGLSFGMCALCGCSQGAVEQHALCAWDSCAPLKHPQRSFASDACRSAYHDSLHPRINQPGVEPACGDGSIKARIAALLSSDGLNRTGDQIAYELRISGATALRELRKLRHDGARIHMQRLHGPRRPAVFFMDRAAKPVENIA